MVFVAFSDGLTCYDCTVNWGFGTPCPVDKNSWPTKTCETCHRSSVTFKKNGSPKEQIRRSCALNYSTPIYMSGICRDAEQSELDKTKLTGNPDYTDVKGRVCFCNSDKCNDMESSDNGTSSGTNGGTGTTDKGNGGGAAGLEAKTGSSYSEWVAWSLQILDCLEDFWIYRTFSNQDNLNSSTTDKNL